MTNLSILARRFAAPRKADFQRGVTLIELMVAIVIGLFLVAVVGILFVNSKVTYLAQDANSRIQENSRYAVELISRQVRTAGFRDIQFNQLSSTNLFAPAFSTAFSGAAIDGTEGSSSAPDSITVSYDATTDCLGQPVATPVVNQFRINAQQKLECLGNGGANPGVVLDDVEDIQLLYCLRDAAGNCFTYLPAGNCTNCVKPSDMANVGAVRACFLLRALAESDKRATGHQQQTYLDCQGVSRTASDGYLRRSVTMTIDLRNRLQ